MSGVLLKVIIISFCWTGKYSMLTVIKYCSKTKRRHLREESMCDSPSVMGRGAPRPSPTHGSVETIFHKTFS